MFNSSEVIISLKISPLDAEFLTIRSFVTIQGDEEVLSELDSSFLRRKSLSSLETRPTVAVLFGKTACLLGDWVWCFLTEFVLVESDRRRFSPGINYRD